jgi:dihydroxy-acid dehydratase
VREGDPIGFDLRQRRLDIQVSSAELQERLRDWQAPAPKYATGVFAKYTARVTSAAQGAVTL